MKSVRDAFAETLGVLLALGMNPDAQVCVPFYRFLCDFLCHPYGLAFLSLGASKGKRSCYS